MPSTPIPHHALAPPPEGIYRSFEDLLGTVQRAAKENGYGVVKLRASNYRDSKPTRYDLVCDRGGVKYSSTAKKRNPSTRKVDCPFRAKAVCEVQLGNQWRFAVQEGRHNHEPRIPTTTSNQEGTPAPGGASGAGTPSTAAAAAAAAANANAPLAQNLRTMTNKLDRLSHDFSQGMGQLNSRLDGLEKRLDTMEQRLIMGASMGGGHMGQPNQGMGMGGGMPNPPGVVDNHNRLNNVEARINAMENRVSGIDMPMVDDVESRLLSGSMGV